MSLNELKTRAYKIACEHGWHEAEQSDETLLMLIITEIAEAVNADRRNLHADVKAFKKYEDSVDFMQNFERQIKNTVEDELSDVVIRCLSMAGSRNLDLSIAHQLIEILGELKPNVPFPEACYRIVSLATADEGLITQISSVLAVVLKYCECKGIDIEWFIEQKMKYNALRPYKHGGKKY